MSKNIIPKEQLSAYQRWELDAFEDTSRAEKSQRCQVTLPTAEAIEVMHQQAHQEGYSEGFEQGKAAGIPRGAGAIQAGSATSE